MNTEWMNEWEKQIEKENVSENEPYDQERPWWWLLSQKVHQSRAPCTVLPGTITGEWMQFRGYICALDDRGLAHNQAALNRMCEMKANA